MLKDWVSEEKAAEKDTCKARLKELRGELAGLQQKLRQANLPVIVLLEGWGAAGKGSAIRSLIRELDPRFFRVLTVDQPTKEERRWPFLKRHFSAIPAAGKLLFLDSGWVNETVQDYQQGALSDQEFARQLDSIRVMERQLTAGGYLLVKLFFHIDAKQQRDRLEELAAHRDTAWRVSDGDWRQNKNYDKYLDCFDRCLEATHTAWAPWKIIDGSRKAQAQLEAAEWLYQQICTALESKPEVFTPEGGWELEPMPLLAQVKLDKTLEEKRYRKELNACKKRLAELHNELYWKKVPIALVYEGWDAAGKGGNIKRLTSGLDPRGYEVIPIASPTPDELSRHYLWRFWTRLPKTGHIAVFDRSWYGRVMVERLEGFCSEDDWKRA